MRNRLSNMFDTVTVAGQDKWFAAVVTDYICRTGRVLSLNDNLIAQMILASSLGEMPDDMAEKLATLVKSN